MESHELLIDAFGRVKGIVHRTADGLTPEQLAFRPSDNANSIAWLIWHLTRIQDDHIADLTGKEQVWTSGGWYDKFGLPFDAAATGYGHTSSEVAAVRADAEELLGYHDAVHEQTVTYLQSLTAEDYAKVVDAKWDPPVTLGIRLISILSDNLQHAGQAAYVRGLITIAV